MHAGAGKGHGLQRAPTEDGARASRRDVGGNDAPGADGKAVSRMSIAEGKFLEEARRGAASSSEHGLQRWVQFVLADTEQTLASAHTAYTKLAQQRLDAKARGQVREVLQSARVQEALSRLAEEVGAGKLQVREDKNVATDLGLRDSILRLALSFSPVYLRPALEALFRRTIPRAHERDSVNLYRFMLAHVTKNAELAAKS